MRKLIVTLATTFVSLVLGATTQAGADEEFNCRAFDNDGSVISETNASSAMDCSRRMMDAVKAAKCDQNKGKSYRYSIQIPKAGTRRTPQSVFCVSK